ncbi:MAG TPA: Ig-like domain-containing protein [Tepidisphaeraceae bacterium]|jgi:hypothetical protein
MWSWPVCNGNDWKSAGSNITITFDEGLNLATFTADRFVLRDTPGAVILATLTYDSTKLQVTLEPTLVLVSSAGYYTMKIAGDVYVLYTGGSSDVPWHHVVPDRVWVETNWRQTLFTKTLQCFFHQPGS